MKYLLPGLLALSLLTVACSVESELKDWQFSQDGEQWEAVTVPHSYNAQDGQTQHYYRGKAHYRREVTFRAIRLSSYLSRTAVRSKWCATIRRIWN